MNVSTTLGRALLLAAASTATTGALADITLYEHARFGGEQITLRGSNPDLSGTGFNDKASSAIVRSGRWEICTNSSFRGNCTVLTRGEYPSLQTTLNDRISSARDTRGRRGNDRDDDPRDRRDGRDGRDGRAGDGVRRDELPRNGTDRVGGLPDSYANEHYTQDGRREGSRRDGSQRGVPGRGGIGLELYSDAGFGGDRLRIERDTTDLSRANFNDRASSVVVTGGTWEICSDARFGGNCAQFRPGQYDQLGGLNGQVSSVRRVR